MIKINICNDFSETPGGRYKQEGKYSGEEFRDTILIEKYKEAIKNQEKLQIDFDNCFGFATSFLEEAFGGLVRSYKLRNVLKNIEIIANDDETIPILIEKYITAAEREV